MIHVTFDPTDPSALTDEQRQWWTAWEERAGTATEEVIEDWETWLAEPEATRSAKFTPKWDEDVWKDLRDWLLDNVFQGKCAYCEHKMVRAVHHGEHFRPKGQVKVRPLGMKKMQPGVTCHEWHPDPDQRVADVPHPGYFWLAYHWKNIVPACEACNTRQGKKDQFPVASRHVAAKRVDDDILARLLEPKIQSQSGPDIYYLQPDDLDVLEDRLLLHPYFDDPDQHLIFSETGIVAACHDSAKGKNSIAVYDLNGEELVKDRFNWQQLMLTKYLAALASANGLIDERRQAAEQVLEQYRQSGSEYVAAVVANIHQSLSVNRFEPVPPGD